MSTTQIFQFKVTLRGIRPPIWRRFQVRGDSTFLTLHRVIQIVMGWHGGHLHLFNLGGLSVADLDLLDDWGDEGADEADARINQHLKDEKTKFRYEYDFGDSWEHEVVLEKILPAEAGASYPRCLTGKRACPPEDCGGVWGYANLLEAQADPDHPDHKRYLEWLGEPFDPEAFNLDEINETLDYYSTRRR